MNISGLSLTEISKILQPYIADYFVCCELVGLDDGMFAESYMLGFEEVEHLIPVEYKSLFKVSDNFNGASGFLNFNYMAKRFRGCMYTVMLLSDENYSKALFLYVQENNLSTDAQRDILIADFMKDDLR